MTTIRLLTPSKMAKAYGVSLPTFLEWLKPIVADNEEISIFYDADWTLFWEHHRLKDVKFRCKYKTINADEAKTICALIGDPDCIMNYEKTTISSLAKKAGISVKTGTRVVKRDMKIQRQGLFALNYKRKSKCLTPREANIIRKLFGID